MLKKVLLVTAIVAGVGVLIFGAVNRTMAFNNTEISGSGGRGRGNSEVIDAGGEVGNMRSSQEGTGANSDNGRGQNNPLNINANESGQGKGGQGNGSSPGQESWLSSPTFEGSLTAEEISALNYMREEEKLARDVYTELYEKWGQQIFLNISQSEQNHMNSVLELLDGYGLPDPASSEAGKFSDPKLQELYTELVAAGVNSLPDALKVGAAIEEIDILDLESRLAQSTNMDVIHVFENLKAGSLNHLSAFTSNLARQTGEAYTPQYMSLDAYNAIISTQNEAGGKGNDYRGGRTS